MESKQNAFKLGIFVVVLLLGFALFILGAIEMAWAPAEGDTLTVKTGYYSSRVYVDAPVGSIYEGVAFFFMGLGGILIGVIGIAGSASAMSAAKKQGAPASKKAPAPAYPAPAPYGAPAPMPAAPAYPPQAAPYDAPAPRPAAPAYPPQAPYGAPAPRPVQPSAPAPAYPPQAAPYGAPAPRPAAPAPAPVHKPDASEDK